MIQIFLNDLNKNFYSQGASPQGKSSFLYVTGNDDINVWEEKAGEGRAKWRTTGRVSEVKQ